MTGWQDYKEPEPPQGDTYKPIEHVGAVLAVKIKQRKEGIVTSNSPDGGPGVIVDLVDLGDGKVYRDVLWMGGAIVDGLTPYVGGKMVVQIEERKSQTSGRKYPTLVGVDGGPAKAQAYVDKHGDPFADQWATPAAQDDSKPPF